MRFTSRDIARAAAIVGALIAAFSFAGCGGDGAVPAVVASGDDTSNADVLLADVADAQTDADVLVDTVSDVPGEVGADANDSADDASDSGPTDAVTADAADTADVPVAPSTCKSDKDCSAAGKVCDPLTLVCVACLSDAECGPSQHCVGLACQTFTGCTNSLGCKTAKGPDGLDQPICDQKSSECTACLTAADCPASNDCIAKACVPFKTCQNSTDCGTTQVCDKASNRCVDCLGNADCQANELCEAGTCKPFVACASDKQCTPLGLLCDTAKGKCAQCLQNTDCPEIYNCQKVAVAQTGKCVLDVCAQGQGACANNAKVTCDLVGDGYGSPQACAAQTTCVAPGSKPECKAWVCTPGTNCNGEKVVTCSDDGLIDRLVLVHRLREVSAQIGFTRFEGSLPDVHGELDLDVEMAPLSRERNWLPANENRGEGVFISFSAVAIKAWLDRSAVQERAKQLTSGFNEWRRIKKADKATFPGLPYIMLQSLAHMMITALSLDCGYSASAIRERIYAGDSGYAILLYTGTPGSEGSLGGLVEMGRNIGRALERALELGRLCSNDPVCAQHEPADRNEARFLHGAACHGCLLIAETSCERRNELLDRALVVPTVATRDAAFFRDPV